MWRSIVERMSLYGIIAEVREEWFEECEEAGRDFDFPTIIGGTLTGFKIDD